MKQSLRRALQVALWPIRRILDPRVADLARRITDARLAIHDESAATRVQINQQVGTYAVTSTESMTFLGGDIRELADRIDALDAELRATLSAAEGLQPALLEELTRAAEAGGRQAHEERIDRLVQGRPQDLDAASAALVNFAAGSRGFAAQTGLWTAPPIVLEHAGGAVRVSHVAEAIVEVPFALRALADVPSGGRVLVLDATASPLALSAATLGYAVTAPLFSPAGVGHPRLDAAPSDLAAMTGPFDGVVCLSALDAVGEDEGRALSRLGELCAPDGIVVLSLPHGEPADPESPARDAAPLEALTDGWDVRERLVVERTDHVTWTGVDGATGRALVMLALRPRSSP